MSSRRPPRDPAAPKRNMSAYLLYQNAMRDTFKQQVSRSSSGSIATACVHDRFAARSSFPRLRPCLSLTQTPRSAPPPRPEPRDDLRPALQVHLGHVRRDARRREGGVEPARRGRQGAVPPRAGELRAPPRLRREGRRHRDARDAHGAQAEGGRGVLEQDEPGPERPQEE